ncbi:MAG: hypothetical protein J0L92_36095 [Deltaproteobacteria bacterium]|nr:hypothetical protein [Deltaproteobacteria bacterium]
MDAPFAVPRVGGSVDADGWVEEVTRYRLTPRPKPMFHTILDARRIFSDGATAVVTTRVREAALEGEVVTTLDVRLESGSLRFHDHFEGVRRGGMVGQTLHRTMGPARDERVDFAHSPYPFPPSTYPDVLIPFLMRGQPLDGERRALYSWTCDRFCARVYYESKGKTMLTVPAGRIEVAPVVMYPDLNDWVSLGSVLTRLAKPLLPRYEMWFEAAPPHRVVRYEGAFGPPGAPEVVLELS